MGERHSEFARDMDDWYVEPAWCVDRLLECYPTLAALHDPCCGMGTVLDAARARGVLTTGADLVDRMAGLYPVRDFFKDTTAHPNIVTNPPFKIAPEIVVHALEHTKPSGIVAVIAQAKFLFSQARHGLFTMPAMERVIVFSRRPSMPPGEMLTREGEGCRGGGSIDFVWCVWRGGKTAPGCKVEWTL